MNKVVILICLFFGLVISTFSQDVSLPRDVAEKALKAIELVPVLEEQNKQLKEKIELLEKSQQTPCSIAIASVTKTLKDLELVNTSNLSEKDSKEFLKMRKKTYSFIKNNSSYILQSQCNYKKQNKLESILKLLVPFSILLLP